MDHDVSPEIVDESVEPASHAPIMSHPIDVTVSAA